MKKTYKIVTLLLTAVFLLGTFILPISAGAATVIDITAEITGRTTLYAGEVFVLEFQQGGTRTEKVSEETDIAAYIAEKKSAFEAATAGGGSSDIIVEQNGYEAFFTENTYAEIYMFEYVGTICKLSDDAIVKGDIDDFHIQYQHYILLDSYNKNH